MPSPFETKETNSIISSPGSFQLASQELPSTSSTSTGKDNSDTPTPANSLQSLASNKSAASDHYPSSSAAGSDPNSADHLSLRPEVIDPNSAKEIKAEPNSTSLARIVAIAVDEGEEAKHAVDWCSVHLLNSSDEIFLLVQSTNIERPQVF